MQIVIDIPEEEYNTAKFMGFIHKDIIFESIKNSIPLPKNHGKIVDLGKIDEDKINKDNPIMTINIDGMTIEAVPLDYLYNLPDLINKDGE